MEVEGTLSLASKDTNVIQAFKFPEVLTSSSDETLAALEAFDVQGVVDAHDKLHKAATMVRGKLRVHYGDRISTSYTPCPRDRFCKPASLLPCSGSNGTPLRGITLSEMEVDHWHRGRALHGTLLVKPINMLKIVASVLVDDSGKAARLLLMNVLRDDTTPDEVQRMLPHGGRIVIKEPCLVRDRVCNGVHLWVPNPASVEVVSHFRPSYIAMFSRRADTAREEGNRQFWHGDLEAATELYSISVSLFRTRRIGAMRALSNRAEAWLKLGYFDRALKDASEALDVYNLHAKSIARKVSALWALKQYTSAYEFVKNHPRALEVSPCLYDDAAEFKKQSVDGKYDLDKFLCKRIKAEKVPGAEFADYVGPVEIGLADGRGRGLFLTSDVWKGDLLFVCNPVATVGFNPATIGYERSDLLAAVISACRACPRSLEQVYSMAEVTDVVSESEKLAVMDKPVPSMDLFRPNVTIGGNVTVNPVLDVVKIHNVVQLNTEVELRGTLVADDMCGLWTLASFANHSCLPNVVFKKMGRAIFAFAAQDISSGCELLRSYSDDLMLPLAMRKAGGSDFECKCPRCELETELGDELMVISDRFKKLRYEHGGEKTARKLAQLAVDLETKIRTLGLDHGHRQMVRASYALAYFRYSWLERCGKLDVEGMPREDVMVRACHEVAPGGLSTLEVIVGEMKDSGFRKREEALDVLQDEMLVQYGALNPEVVHQLIHDFQTRRMGVASRKRKLMN